MIALRPLEPEDLATLYEIENNPELWSRTSSPTPVSRFTLRNYIAEGKTLQEDGELRLAIDDIGQSEKRETVGFVDLTDYNPLSRRSEVSLTLLKNYLHQGYGLQALLMLESYALRLARMHQLYATISDDNLASRRLFEKAGYEASGRLIDWHYDGVKYQNCTFYAKILKKNASKDLVE